MRLKEFWAKLNMRLEATYVRMREREEYFNKMVKN